MSHFSNLAIDEQNKIRETFLVWRFPEKFKATKSNNQESEGDMFGGDENKPSQNNDKFSGLGAGKHVLYMTDMNSGVSDSTGKQYWMIELTKDENTKFNHFINCEPSEYKTEEKVYNSIARQMEALMIYDKIGKHETLESFVQAAIDTTWELKGKKIEFTIKKYKFDDKEGLWGEITGFLDVPNEAVQNAKAASAPTDGGTSFDTKEEIPF